MMDVSSLGPSRIDLTWTAPDATGGGAITGYKIEYSNTSAATPAADTWKALVANLNKTEDEVEGDDGTQITYTDDGSVANASRRVPSGGTGCRRSTPPARACPLIPPFAVMQRPLIANGRDQCADGPDGHDDGADANRPVMDCAHGHQRR